MSNQDKMLQARIDIETSAEISFAILSEIMDNSDDERMQYIILGVLQQQEEIKKSAAIINEVLKEERVRVA